jgi:hypothetical protein
VEARRRDRLATFDAVAVAPLAEEAHRLVDLDLELTATIQHRQLDLLFFEVPRDVQWIWTHIAIHECQRQ